MCIIVSDVNIMVDLLTSFFHPQGHRVLAELKHSQASVGAACHSHNCSMASPSLVASGVPEKVAVNALRVSVGRETTKTDVEVFVQDLKDAINTLESL